jgi:hypothetical protein
MLPFHYTGADRLSKVKICAGFRLPGDSILPPVDEDALTPEGIAGKTASPLDCPSVRRFRRYGGDNSMREALMTEQRQNHFDERMTIRGDLEPASFVPWINRHAAKLGLVQKIAHSSSDRIELELSGSVELIDMMEMGCSLGPIDVWVETIDRAPADRETI